MTGQQEDQSPTEAEFAALLFAPSANTFSLKQQHKTTVKDEESALVAAAFKLTEQDKD